MNTMHRVPRTKRGLPRLRGSLLTVLLSTFLLLPSGLKAQTFPSRPVAMVIGFPAGGGADVMARALAARLSELWSQTTLVDNKGGAGTTIAAAAVAKAAPDGYTLFMTLLPVHAISSQLYRTLPYDTATGFTPISVIAKGSPLVLIASVSSKVDSAKSLIEQSRAKPGSITYGTVGIGSSVHLTMEMFAAQAGIQLLHVPYKGGAAVQLAVAGGEIDTAMTDPSVLPLIKSGKVRALGVTSLKRWPLLPDTPSVAESVLPDFESIGTVFVVGPAGMPPQIVSRIRTSLQEALRSSSVQKQFATVGFPVETSTPEGLQALIMDDIQRYGAIIKKLDIKPE